MLHKYLLFNTDPGGGAGGSGDPDPDPDPDPSPGGDPEPTGDTVPRSELAKVNAEAAKYRRERNDLKKRVEELEGASKTELEREKERAANAEKEANAATAKNLLLRAAVLAPKAGVHPDAAQDAAQLLNWDGIEDPSSDDQVSAALADLVKAKPYLRGTGRGSADGGAGSGDGNEPLDMNTQLRRAAGRV